MKVEDSNINETTKQNGSPQDLSNSQLKGEKTKRKKRSSKKSVDINSGKSNEPQIIEATGHDLLNTTDAEIENKDEFAEEILISNSENNIEETAAITENEGLAEIENSTSEEAQTEVVAESEAQTEVSEEAQTEVVAESEAEETQEPELEIETQGEAEILSELNDEIELESEAEPEQPKKRKRRITFFKLFLSFTALFTLGCAAYIVSLFLTSETMLFTPKLDVELPNFQGMTTNQIEANEEFSSFNIVYEAVYTSEVATGVVIEQRPKAPRQVKEGSNVTLRVSVGTRKVEVPDVTGLTSTDAKEKLRDNELYVLFKPIYDDEILEDYVVKTEPESGAYLDAGETITVYISRGEEEATTAKVPNCVGMTSTKTAGQIIASRGLRLDTVKKVLSDAPEGTIISQSPSEGMVVPRGTGVILTVASSEAGLLAADHAHDFAVSIVEPNSYSIGFTLYTCTICGYYYYTNVTGPI